MAFYFTTFYIQCIVNVMKMLYNFIEVINMQKDSTISLRIDAKLKSDVEKILDDLGIPMTTAITMYFSQIRINNGIPFTPSLPAKPKYYEDYSKDELVKICENGAEEYYGKKTVSSNYAEKMMKEKMKRGL